MKKYILITILMLSALSILTGCPDSVEEPTISCGNLSDQNIHLHYTYDANNLLPENKEHLGEVLYSKPNGRNWKMIYVNTEYDSIYISLLNGDTVNTYSWEVVREKDMILKRYRLSTKEKELKKINFTLEYKK